MVQLVLKDRKSILDFFISTESDISNEVNKFYLSIAGRVITVDGFCEEESVFTCKEFPEYVIPMEFISHKQKQATRINDEFADETFIEIAKHLGFSAQGARALFNRAIEKTKKIINSNNQRREYFNV